MLNGPIDELTQRDLEGLIGTPESRALDFKRDGVGTNDDAKKELLCDVSAFANTQGGHVIYGMEERDGLATGLVGFDVRNPDEEVGRILQILNTGLEPRLPSVQVALIPLDTGRFALVIRVRTSHIAPHRVTFREHSKFYKRHGTIKLPMDTFELRLAFNAAQGVPAQIEAIHDRLVQRVKSGRAPVAIDKGKPYFVVSIVPVEAVSGEVELDLQYQNCLMPLNSSGGIDLFHTFDGCVSVPATTDTPSRFALTGRAGFAQYAFRPWLSGGNYFHMQNVERDIGQAVERGVGVLTAKHGLAGPFSVHLSLIRCSNVTATWNEHTSLGGRLPRSPIEEDLDFRPVVFDAFSDAALEPLVRHLWFAFGEERDRGMPLGGAKGAS